MQERSSAHKHRHIYTHTNAGRRRSAARHLSRTNTKHGTALKGTHYWGKSTGEVGKANDRRSSSGSRRHTHTRTRTRTAATRGRETGDSTARRPRRPACSAPPHPPQHTGGNPAVLSREAVGACPRTHTHIPRKERQAREREGGSEQTKRRETQQPHARRERRAVRANTAAATLRGGEGKQQESDTHWHTHTHRRRRINARIGRDMG